ncbi:MAG: DNA replication/repair protein RecF [Thermomicrobiales bacterium]
MATEAVWLRRLKLDEFRVYRQLELTIGPTGLRIVGPNGTGKTSVIEALLLLSTTRSRRGVLDADLINHESGIDLASRPYTRVEGEIDSGSTTVELDIFIERTDGNSTRKLIRVGDAPRKAADVVGLFPTVSFSPEDLDLVIGSPSVRRRFLDVLLSQVDREYMRHLSRYGRMISQRNSLLKAIGGGGGQRNELEFWDDQIIALGAYLIAARAVAVQSIAEHATTIFGEIATFQDDLSVVYRASLEQPDAWWEAIARDTADIRAVSQRVGAVFESALRDALPEDIARGVSTIGPHRDDIDLELGGRPIQRFGSRGQQRLAIVALKLAEIEFMAGRLQVRPALLLDDVLSELDASHRDELLRRVSGGRCQMFVTATDLELADHESLASLDLMVLDAPGQVAGGV